MGGGAIDADDLAAEGDELFGEDAVAAAEVEDALAGLRGEEFDDRCAKVGDEAGMAVVEVGVPGLGGGHGCDDRRGLRRREYRKEVC